MTPHDRTSCDLCRRYPQPPPHAIRVWSQRRGDETIGLTIDELMDDEKEKKE